MESAGEKAILNIMENSPDKYFCTLCSPVYSICSDVSHSLELHIRSTHPESRSLRCIYCSELVSSVSISRHIDMHFCSTVTQNLPYTCPCCPRSYGTMKALAQHALSLHNIDKRDVFFKCGHCDKPVSSPKELKSHLCKYSLILFRCCFPNCRVMSKNVEVMKQHSLSFHGTNSPLVNTSYSFMCSWPSSILPTRIRAHSPDSVKLNRRVPSTFFCAHCSFGTAHLENFAQHLAICRAISSHLLITSLSVTCVLHRCSECGWMTNVRNMLTEHLQDMHPLLSEEEGVITEDFTVPISDESITENYNFISKNMETLRNSPLQQLPSFFSSGNPTFLHTNNGATLRNDLPLLYSAASNLSAEVSKHLSNVHGPSSIDSCEADEVGDHEEHVRAEVDNDELKKSNKDVNLNNRPISSNLPPDVTESKPEIITETTAEEYVQLYFNEQAFVSAYIKNEKFNNNNNDTTNDELNNVLEKLRRFASYRVPILGRANQRRVAGCPECLKPFNHGFTDLKKHLLVTHLGVRRDISRFTIDFTHSGRSHNSGIPSQTNNSLASSGNSPQSKHSFGIRNGRLSSKAFRRKPFPISSLSPLCKRPTSGKYEDSQKSPTEPLATTSSDGLPTLVTSGSSYSGGAPVHRVIPGTGVSDHHEDMRSLEEVSAQAPIGRGGIIPLDEMGNPIVAAVVAAGQPQTSTYSGGTEIFLPKVGRQRVQLAYSFPVFKRLLEAYQVPMPERIQLVNRMNHYARMHVIMDVLVPGGAQKRFSCPTCMYTSVHSLADIRKHIMGSHCGISTKRFRLCLRASRHDTTTYRLHSDDRMIRFVEDHRRRQIQLTDARATIKVTSTDSDTEETKEESSETHSQLVNDENNNISNEFSKSQVSFNDQEELETQTIETDVYDDSHHDGVQGADEESDNRFLTANINLNSDDNLITPSKSQDNSAVAAGDNSTTYSDENIKQNEELHRRIELPFSDNVLHVLLEREGMLDQYDDLVVKMQIYSKHHLTVVSRGNRIYSYICICGRRFAVVRDEVESDIRPASLADCRRHILGVHARIPQELLTLCCQASRISKESGYKLYADSSLLALAEQHKFRSTRIQSYSRKSEGGISPIKRPLEPMIPNDVEGIPEFSGSNCSVNSVNPRSSTSYSSMSFNHSAPSQVALHHSSSYSSNHPLPPMLRAPTVKYEVNELDESPPSEYSRLNGKTSTINLSKKSPEPNPYTFEERHSGLDLEAPRRMLTPEESVTWSQKLGLPTSWALERIVRLLYSPAVFDHQVRSVLPDGDNFIASLHERMKVYARHSVYITRMRETPNLTQRIYVCCACLTTSHHGFGDVRKHILGVHAHVPERFKSAAMCSSRLNRDDYFLYTDSQLLLLANSPGRNVNLSTLGATSNKTIPPVNHSPGPQKHRQCDSECISPQHTPSRKRRCSGNESDPIDFGIKPEHSSQFLPDESSHTVHLNGHTAFSPDMPAKSYEEHDEHRPPIILTIPRPKAFHPSDQPDDIPLRLSSINVAKPIDDYINPEGAYSSSGSRSRRSMILKSKRPCPTST
ncbi:Zinc finger protein [Schistosoma japonicum]|nr:Zinc finger protein [Schistosoma japonicum]